MIQKCFTLQNIHHKVSSKYYDSNLVVMEHNAFYLFIRYSIGVVTLLIVVSNLTFYLFLGECKTTGWEKCQFPYIYQGVKHHRCTTHDAHEYWCATEIQSSSLQYVEGKWGQCDDNCPKEKGKCLLEIIFLVEILKYVAPPFRITTE